jgi:hypothetical protein
MKFNELHINMMMSMNCRSSRFALILMMIRFSFLHLDLLRSMLARDCNWSSTDLLISGCTCSRNAAIDRVIKLDLGRL